MSEQGQDPGRKRASRPQDSQTLELRQLLASIITRQVVPGLVTANRSIEPEFASSELWRDGGFNLHRAGRDADYSSMTVRTTDVMRFVRLLRGGSVDAASAFVEILQSRGVGRQDICLDLLAPAARTIGAMWLDDECSFADVSMVVGRLHQIVKTFQDASSALRLEPDAPLLLLSPAPGEQHVFALDLVSAFFTEGGWRTEQSHTNDADEIVERVASKPYDAVGLTLSRPDAAEVLRATIMRMRAVVPAGRLLVLVGGPAFDADPLLARHVGADSMAEAGVAGAVQARRLLPSRH